MKILIVDDEPLVRRSLQRACTARGHQVMEAVDGLDGLEKWKTFLPDLVFLDVLMPRMSGPEVMRQRPNQAKIVLMSAFAGEHAPAQEGADLFLPKPFEDIFAVVAKAEALVCQM